MNKKIISLALAVLLLLSLPSPVFAEPTELKIASLEEFLTFAKNCRLDSYSWDLQVVLECDIDLTGTDFTGVPIFGGSFDGNNHTVSGFSFTADGSDQGLFRYLTATAQVKNLTVKAQLHPTGSRSQIGGIAGVNRGSIDNCQFTGDISGSEYIGGIAGLNTVTGRIENCTVEGNLYGDHFVGGIAGSNAGVIKGCKNRSSINTTPQQNSVDISDITMDTLLNTEAVNTVTDIGGIAGGSSGVIRECENRGHVGYPQIGYNVGGIAGTQSGYIADCHNYGSIQGRKEVGGIVGQMEPALLMEYSTDTLQILEGQLGTMSSMAGQAAGNAQAHGTQLTDQLNALQGQIEDAQAALEILTPGAELPDPDEILAAQNTLSAALGAMPETLERITASGQGLASDLNRDLNGLFTQIQEMEKTIGSAKENLGGSFLDASDEDTEKDLTGKVEGCVNSGAVLADLNAGGIAGAMSLENDLDALQDWEQSGDLSLNFQSKLRGVILCCENRGTVSGKKQFTGGIVGLQSLGLVKDCTNSGKLDSEKASFVGGIAGQSLGYIRNSYAKCELWADLSAGGIAGSGAVVTDCISMVRFHGGQEKLGAILGEGEAKELAGNIYLVIDRDLGAIDGISYAGQAEPVELDEFLATENLPELFKTVTVRFVFEDGTEETVSLVPGSTLDPEQIPMLPEKSGFSARFASLAETDTEHVLFDMTFLAEYTAYRNVIQSHEDLPVVLVEGSFTDTATVTAEKSTAVPTLQWGQTHLQTWKICSQEGGTQVRLLCPGEDDLVVMVNTGSSWKKLDYSRADSYLVFDLEGTEMTVAVVKAADFTFLFYVVGGAVLLAAAIVTVLLVRKRKKQAQTVQ